MKSAHPQLWGVPSARKDVEKSLSRVRSTWPARNLNFTFATLSRNRYTAALPGGDCEWPFGRRAIHAVMPEQIWNLSLFFSWPWEKLDKSQPNKSQEKDVPKATCKVWLIFSRSPHRFWNSSQIFDKSAFFLSSSSHLFPRLWRSQHCFWSLVLKSSFRLCCSAFFLRWSKLESFLWADPSGNCSRINSSALATICWRIQVEVLVQRS